MELRNRAERAIRRFHALETVNGNAPVIDYDCAPTDETIEPYPDRFTALDELTRLEAEAVEGPVAEQMRAHATYMAALLGEQIPLNEYVQRTQGCPARGWSEEYLQHRRDLAREALAVVGVAWGERTRDDLRALDEQLDPGEVRDAISASAAEFEPRVREMAGTTAGFNLTIENVEVDAYWSYWLDGAGHDARLRINVTNAAFTRLDAYRFAAHEVLGHALQYSSLTTYAEKVDVDWPRLLAVHSNHQVLGEGLAQLLPFALKPDNPLVAAFARLDHYAQLVRAQLHLLVNSGGSANECRARAQEQAPWLTSKDVERELRDRSRDPQLRTYLWAYPAGIDWFVNLFEQRATLLPEVLRAAYERPLSPSELRQLWPGRPAIGGDA